MFTLRSFLVPAVLGLGLLAAYVPRADAQKGGGGRSSPAPSSSRPSVSPSTSRGSSMPSASALPKGTGPHNNPSMHNNRTHYTYPLYSGYSYYRPYGYVAPLYNYSYYPPLYDSQPYYPAPNVLPAPPVDQPAYIEVRLPTADAQVFLDGNKTSSTGPLRVYNSPALAPGEYTYEVTATWMQEGQNVQVTRTIRVVPGRTTLVDFTK